MELSMSQLDQLESEAAAQRALFADAADGVRSRIADTADDLRENLSPSRIVRRTGENWRSWIEQRARDNPIQVASAAAMLAYPAWRIARALPLPVLIAGAGVLLSGKARLSATQAGEFLADAGSKTRKIGNRLADATAQASDTAAENLGLVGASATESVNRTSDTIREAASSAAGNIKEHLARATETATAALSGAVESMTPSEATIQSLRGSARVAANTAADITEQAARSGAAYSRAAADAIAQNPLLIGGLGLAAGGLLAALLPHSKADGQILGGLARSIQDGTNHALSEGHQRATQAVSNLQRRAVGEAEARGLMPGAIQDAVDDLKDRANDVAVAAKRAIKHNAPHSGEPS
jgi:uncharacterized protein YjbJ (UPF0337 family)